MTRFRSAWAAPVAASKVGATSEKQGRVRQSVDDVKRPIANGNEGSTPALGDAQARKLLDSPPRDSLKGVRDRAILATLLYHGMRREELCGLRVRDIQSRQGVMHFRSGASGARSGSFPCMRWCNG